PPPALPSARHTPSLHDALPIYRLQSPRHSRPSQRRGLKNVQPRTGAFFMQGGAPVGERWIKEAEDLRARGSSGTMLRNHNNNKVDRKSTRLNSSHVSISYAVFC